jgi:predicted nucleic acid-binding protein
LTEAPIVCNAGPLIALATVNRLDLLPSLYPRVLVPEAVTREIIGSGMDRAGVRQIESASWLEMVPSSAVDPLLAAELGAGESEVISTAVRLRARLALIDERRARRIASQVYNLAVKGTVGVLVEAKRATLLPQVRPLLEALVRHGYYLSQRLVEYACREVGE